MRLGDLAPLISIGVYDLNGAMMDFDNDYSEQKMSDFENILKEWLEEDVACDQNGAISK